MLEEQFNETMKLMTMAAIQTCKSRYEIMLRLSLGGAPGMDPPKNMFPVELKNSKLHGKGVFAVQSIKKGELITMYPAHAVAYVDGKGATKVVCYDKEKQQNNFSLKYAQFMYNTGLEKVFIVGNPEIEVTSAGIGHFVNDPYPDINMLETNPKTFKAVGKAYIDYELRTQQSTNAKIVSKHLYAYVVATKDIEPGEEVLA
jgi:hypothetical protein